MLTRLGQRSPQPRTMREMLTDCHARIRHFCALGKRLAEGGPAEQLREAAGELVRYFAVALPLHVRDEDENVRPRLARLGDGALDAALAKMSAEHLESEAALVELLAAWRDIAAAADAARCADTARAAATLAEHFERHLRDEEAIVFPALDRLPASEQQAIVAEMQARRR